MYIEVIDRSSVVVREPDVLTSLRVIVSADTEAAALVDSGLAREVVGDHVFLYIDRLRAVGAAHDVAAGWTTRFDDMISYADRNGWTSADGMTVRAHITTAPEEAS